MKILKIFMILLVLIIAVLYVSINWQYWTQDVQNWKSLCMFPETDPNHIQTMSDYKICLAKRHITPTDKDIRMMCNSYAGDKYNSQSGTEPSKNTLYSDCLHEEGLSN